MMDAGVPQVVLKPNPRNNLTLFKIFHNVQQSVVQHKKYVKEMKKLYKKIGDEVFRESFKNALYYVFTFGDANANVDRVIQFAATFSTSLDDDDEFLQFIFDIIFECQGAISQSVRYRASQLLEATLAALGQDAALDDDLCEKLLTSQMQRLQDTRGVVRCRAALALNRLQNPTDPNDEVTRGYQFHMSCDPSSYVRRSIVMSIAKCTRNIPFVLERLCDVDGAVRRAAFIFIASMNVTQLRVKQRVFVLKVGLTERNQSVRRVVEEILIPDWLCTYEGNIIEFLKALRLDNSKDTEDSQYVAEKLLQTLFKRTPINELLEWLPIDKSLRLIPVENLTKEIAWYWRHLTQHLHDIENEEVLETVVPDLIVFIDYIKAIVSSPCPSATLESTSHRTKQEIIHDLACMLQVYDTSETTGREALKNTIIYILTGNHDPPSEEVIRALMSSLQKVVPDVTMRIQLVGGIISTLRESDVEQEVPAPIPDDAEIKLQRAKVRVSLNVAIEEQAEAVKDENYDLAAECKIKVAQLQKIWDELNEKTKTPQVTNTVTAKKCDEATLNKCLLILNSLLDTSDLNNITPILKLILDELETEIFNNKALIINGLETIALFGMLDKNFAMDNKVFFFSNILGPENVACKALKCLIDLMCVHGARLFEKDDSIISNKKNQSSTSELKDDDSSNVFPVQNNVVQLLLKLLDNESSEIRLIIVGGLCRLLYLGHIESPSILSKLIILWFNPTTVDEDIMRQIIGTFFQTFPYLEFAQEEIQKATIPTLRALVCAPIMSPLSNIDQEDLVKFLASLTKLSHELIDSQGDMAVRLCTHLINQPGCAEAPLVCRMLALLPPPKDPRLAAHLATRLRELFPNLPDKQSCRNITRYLGSLEAVEQSRLDGVTSERKTDDTMNIMERSKTSLSQLACRSHVIVNETVEEEPEIDETSPRETNIGSISRINEEDTTPDPRRVLQDSDTDSMIITPPKKLKTNKENATEISSEKNPEKNQRGIKRSRSSRRLSDLKEADKENDEVLEEQQSSPKSDSRGSALSSQSDSGSKSSGSKDNRINKQKKTAKTGKADKKTQKKKQNPSPPQSAPRRSSRSPQSSPVVKDRSSFDSDETILHTIIYDNGMEQELLEESNLSIDSRQPSKATVSIPETPDGSEDSDAEIELVIKEKPKRKGK